MNRIRIETHASAASAGTTHPPEELDRKERYKLSSARDRLVSVAQMLLESIELLRTAPGRTRRDLESARKSVVRTRDRLEQKLQGR